MISSKIIYVKHLIISQCQRNAVCVCMCVCVHLCVYVCARALLFRGTIIFWSWREKNTISLVFFKSTEIMIL